MIYGLKNPQNTDFEQIQRKYKVSKIGGIFQVFVLKIEGCGFHILGILLDETTNRTAATLAILIVGLSNWCQMLRLP